MPYRALTHGRVKNSILDVNGNIFTPSTHSQAAAISSQNGVANNGPVAVQRNRNNQSNKQPKRAYARISSTNFLLRPNAYGDPTTFVSGQGKGFPNATPRISVGSTNKFARRAITRRAVTRMIDPESRGCCDDYCPSDSNINLSRNRSYTLGIYRGTHHVGFVDKTFHTTLRNITHWSGNNYVLDDCDAFGYIEKNTSATLNGVKIWGIFRWVTNNFSWVALSEPKSVVIMLGGSVPLSQAPNLIVNGVTYPPQNDFQTGSFVGMLNDAVYTVFRYGDASNNLNQIFMSRKQNEFTLRFS